MLPFSKTKSIVPMLIVEVWQLGIVGPNCLKPIVEDDMVLRSDLARIKAENEWCSMGVFATDPYKHVAP